MAAALGSAQAQKRTERHLRATSTTKATNDATKAKKFDRERFRQVLREGDLMVIAGIDPGQKGGIAILWVERMLAQAWPMPMHGKEPDVAAIMRLFAAKGVNSVAIEQVGAMPKQGVSSTFQFGTGYGMLLGALKTSQLSHYRVRPQAWKQLVLAGTAKDKEAAIAFCRNAHPTLELVPPRCRTPHDGMADAVCLAHWLARTLAGKGGEA